MLRKLLALAFLLSLASGGLACAEKEYKTSTETQTQTESGPRDVDQGEMVVE